MKIQIIVIAISSGLKLLLNIILISNPKIGIYGAAISNVISYILTFVMLLIYMIIHEKIYFKITQFVIKPSIICFVTYIIMKVAYNIINTRIELINVVLSIFLGMMFYLGAIILSKLITKQEIKLIIKRVT